MLSPACVLQLGRVAWQGRMFYPALPHASQEVSCFLPVDPISRETNRPEAALPGGKRWTIYYVVLRERHGAASSLQELGTGCHVRHHVDLEGASLGALAAGDTVRGQVLYASVSLEGGSLVHI